MLFFDEKWTTRVKPYGGVSWRPQGKPQRVPAKYQGRGKVEIFASWDAQSGRVRVECFRRRRTQEVLHFLKQERGLRGGKEVYVVLDNFGSHRSASLRRWLTHQRGPGKLQLVYLPVQAPWLNRVELFFRDLQRDVLNNSAFGGVRELVRAVYRYARWWNAQRAQALCPETALANTPA